MKKSKIMSIAGQCLIVLLISSVFVSVSSAQDMHIGGGVGGYLPTGDAADVLELGLAFQGTFLYGLNEYMKVEGSFGYWMLRFDSELTDEADRYDIDISGSIIPVTGGIRYYMAPTMYLDAGGGLYRIEMEVGTLGISISDSETDFGVYGGGGMHMGPLDVTARVHFPDFDDLYFTALIGYLFQVQ